MARYQDNEEKNLQDLHGSLLALQYTPRKATSYTLPTGRRLFNYCLDDKIVQTAVAGILTERVSYANSVHGFVRKRSVYTAKEQLRTAIKKGIVEYYKADIHAFYESVDQEMLLRKVRRISEDKDFIALVQLLVASHANGISTGSCLSPVLSNLYLSDADAALEQATSFYSRYVDDILIAPKKDAGIQTVIDKTNNVLQGIKLTLNEKKSQVVNVDEGFRYLGFDIRNSSNVEKLIQEGNYAMADRLLTVERNHPEPDHPEPNRSEPNHSEPNHSEPTHSEPNHPEPIWNDSDEPPCHYTKYLELFVRDLKNHYVSTDVDNRYQPVSRPLDDATLCQLIADKREFAVLALEPDNRCSFLVFDIDINRQYILQHGDDGDAFQTLLQQARTTADDILRLLHTKNLEGYVEFSGYKGYHVWVFWKQPITLQQQKIFCKDILSNMEVPLGLHIEKFPTLRVSLCEPAQVRGRARIIQASLSDAHFAFAEISNEPQKSSSRSPTTQSAEGKPHLSPTTTRWRSCPRYCATPIPNPSNHH